MIARRIHGGRRAGELGIARSPFSALLPLAADTARIRRERLRARPHEWAAIEANMVAARAVLAAPDEPTNHRTNPADA